MDLQTLTDHLKTLASGALLQKPRNTYEDGWQNGQKWTARQIMAFVQKLEAEDQAQDALTATDIEVHS